MCVWCRLHSRNASEPSRTGVPCLVRKNLASLQDVFRRAMAGILPEMVRQRRDKLGFATPEEAWFRGPLRELVLGGIEQTLAYFPDLLNPAGVRALAHDMLEGRRAVDFSLWRIVNLGIWGRLFGVAA